MKKVVKAILCVILAGALVGAAALSWVVYQEAHAGDELKKCDVIIVLGARVQTRTSSTCGSAANASTNRRTSRSDNVRMSPPERRTSRTFGCAFT